MSTKQEEGSFASLGSGKWAQRVVNGTDDSAIGSGGGASTADGATFTPDDTAGTITMGVFETTPTTVANNEAAAVGIDSKRNLKVTLATLLAGEDLAVGVFKTEQRFSSSGVKTADAAIKSGAGFIHSITFSQNAAAPTAGTISILDSTAAGAGTALFTWVLGISVFVPFTVTLDVTFSTGLYFDFTTTDNVNVVGSYR